MSPNIQCILMICLFVLIRDDRAIKSGQLSYKNKLVVFCTTRIEYRGGRKEHYFCHEGHCAASSRKIRADRRSENLEGHKNRLPFERKRFASNPAKIWSREVPIQFPCPPGSPEPKSRSKKCAHKEFRFQLEQT